MRVRVENLVVGPNVVAGCNPFVIMSLAYLMRSTSEDPPPITIRPIDKTPHMRIIDGRHRYLAAIIAGRPDIECCVQPDPPGETT